MVEGIVPWFQRRVLGRISGSGDRNPETPQISKEERRLPADLFEIDMEATLQGQQHVINGEAVVRGAEPVYLVDRDESVVRFRGGLGQMVRLIKEFQQKPVKAVNPETDHRLGATTPLKRTGMDIIQASGSSSSPQKQRVYLTTGDPMEEPVRREVIGITVEKEWVRIHLMEGPEIDIVMPNRPATSKESKAVTTAGAGKNRALGVLSVRYEDIVDSDFAQSLAARPGDVAVDEARNNPKTLFDQGATISMRGARMRMTGVRPTLDQRLPPPDFIPGVVIQPADDTDQLHQLFSRMVFPKRMTEGLRTVNVTPQLASGSPVLESSSG